MTQCITTSSTSLSLLSFAQIDLTCVPRAFVIFISIYSIAISLLKSSAMCLGKLG